MSCVCIDSDGNRIISGSEDNTIRIWNILNGECERIFEGHDEVSKIS